MINWDSLVDVLFNLSSLLYAESESKITVLVEHFEVPIGMQIHNMIDPLVRNITLFKASRPEHYETKDCLGLLLNTEKLNERKSKAESTHAQLVKFPQLVIEQTQWLIYTKFVLSRTNAFLITHYLEQHTLPCEMTFSSSNHHGAFAVEEGTSSHCCGTIQSYQTIH